jgi:hypothetical protein
MMTKKSSMMAVGVDSTLNSVYAGCESNLKQSKSKLHSNFGKQNWFLNAVYENEHPNNFQQYFFLENLLFFSFDIKNTDFLYATAHTAITNEIEYILFSHSVTHKAALYVHI